MAENVLDVNPENSQRYLMDSATGDIPERYPPVSNMPSLLPKVGPIRRFFLKILTELAENFYHRGVIDIRETIIDGSFTPAKKNPSVGKAPRSL
jgi:hypothetical protein